MVEHSPVEYLPRVCQMLTNSEIQRQECVRALCSIMERGFYVIDYERDPVAQTRRKTMMVLEKRGVVRKVRLDLCVHKYGKRSVVAYIVDFEALRALYAVLQALKPPPVCVHLEDVREAGRVGGEQ